MPRAEYVYTYDLSCKIGVRSRVVCQDACACAVNIGRHIKHFKPADLSGVEATTNHKFDCTAILFRRGCGLVVKPPGTPSFVQNLPHRPDKARIYTVVQTWIAQWRDAVV